jgi:hypothetical protein
MKCEMCSNTMDGTFGSGRFCCMKCARGFVTLGKRAEINAKVSAALAGKPATRRGPLTPEQKAAFASAMNETKEHRWKFGEWGSVPKGRRKDRVMLEQNGICAICSNPPLWMGKPLRFQLDHINGDNTDNSRVNLRLLCPNCHFQTPTWGQGNASPEGRQRMLEAALRGRATQKKLISCSSMGRKLRSQRGKASPSLAHDAR